MSAGLKGAVKKHEEERDVDQTYAADARDDVVLGVVVRALDTGLLAEERRPNHRECKSVPAKVSQEQKGGQVPSKSLVPTNCLDKERGT